jgi:hypothetical protein
MNFTRLRHAGCLWVYGLGRCKPCPLTEDMETWT